MKLSPLIVDNTISLTVNGRIYSGWKSININHGIDQIAGGFSLTLADNWDGVTELVDVQAGADCVVKIGNDVVITGYIDINDSSIDATSHEINVQGRDKTGDLVDCTVLHREYVGQNFEFIAQDVVKPFGITVQTQLASDNNGYTGKSEIKQAKTGGSKVPKIAPETSDTCHSFLEKISKMQAVMLISDRKGGLLITRAGLAGRATDSLVFSENIKSVALSIDYSQVYSNITVKGQAHGAKTDTSQTLDDQATAHGKGEIKRIGTGRYRPLVIEADEQADAARCRKQATWEASTREAKAKKLEVVVQGWRQSDGKLWEINTITQVISPLSKTNDDFLISNLTFDIDLSGGSVTHLTLYPPKAFDVLEEMPEIEKPTEKERGKTTEKGKGKTSKKSKNQGKKKGYDTSEWLINTENDQ